MRTEDTIVFELLQAPSQQAEAEVVGTATFRNGRSQVEAPEAVAAAVEELLARGFVDRVQATERPRGYRRTGRARVEMLVPGMAEHFVARLRGLWLPYPDGSVVSARQVTVKPEPRRRAAPDLAEGSSPVSDPAVRRGSLGESDSVLTTRPLVVGNEPDSGLRSTGDRIVARTDCGWIS